MTVDTFTPLSNQTISLTKNQSGNLIITDLTSAELILNLPPVEAGIKYEIIIKNNTNSLKLVSKNSSYATTALIYIGQLSTTLISEVTLNTATSHVSDRIILSCDGTHWHTSIISDNVSDYTI